MGLPCAPAACRPRSHGPQPGLRAFQELGSASCLGDQPWLMGPPHPALLPSRPRKPMPSPGAGRTAHGGLVAQSRLSAAPRGLLTGHSLVPGDPQCTPHPPTASGIEPRGLGSDASSSQETLGPSSRWSEASGSSTDEVCGPTNSVVVAHVQGKLPTQPHPPRVTRGTPGPLHHLGAVHTVTWRKLQLGTRLELFFSLFDLGAANSLFSFCFPHRTDCSSGDSG